MTLINVMIVEDDPMVAEFNKRYLEQIDGFHLVRIIHSADNAFTYLQDETLDLLLLDIYMPGSTGLELIEKIRKSGSLLDIIVISAARDADSIKKALRYGAVDYLIKPFEFQRFYQALTTYRERTTAEKEKQSFNQAEVDQLLLNRTLIEKHSSLPKGLTRATLQIVIDKIETISGDFTTDQLANEIGMSRVSMRKYLHFLDEIDVLSKEVSYGSVGRPVFYYTYHSKNENLLRRFL
ncbi:response regulator [Halalkalibacter kiskunsagensis]|uniref:Response regulator n=1 Tax=Halalkalibacter kiskunsagensis TaxID=1548599 RepID=A0ABV6K972_9BACI